MMRELWTFNNVQGYYSTDMGYYDGRNIIPMSSFAFLELFNANTATRLYKFC